MSDPHGQPPHDPQSAQPPQAPEHPWGAPPAGTNPYGGQSTDPYGAQPVEPYAGAPYGSASYGASHGAPYGGAPADPDRRPATVTAAAVITLVTSGLLALLLGLATLALAVARESIIDDIRRELESDPTVGGDVPDADTLAAVALGVMGALTVWCLLACLFAVLVLRRSNAGRILLVVSASISALLSLLAILSGISALTLIASIAVVVLLFVGGAGDWFARRGHDAPLPTGTTQPWG